MKTFSNGLKGAFWLLWKEKSLLSESERIQRRQPNALNRSLAREEHFALVTALCLR